MRRPLVGMLVAYAVGVLLGEWFETPLPLLFGATGLLLACFWAFPTCRWFVWVALLVGAGWVQQVRHQAVLAPHDLRQLLGDEAALAEVRGRLVRRPELKATLVRDTLEWRVRAVIEVSAVRLRGRWHPATGRVLARAPEPLDPEYFAGRHVEVSGVLKPPDPAAAPGLFDYRAHLARRGIHWLLLTDGPRDWRYFEALGPTEPGWSDRFVGWAEGTLARGLPPDDPAVRLRWAMLLGWRGAITDDLSAPFLRSGTMHVFAISGLHVMLIAGILTGGLRVLRLSRAGSGLLVLPLLWFYAGITGWQPSAVRATVMMSVIIGGWALRRPSDLLNSLAGAAFLILLWDPRQLFQAGFQLSFGVVLSLAVVLPWLLHARDRWLQPEPLLPRALRPTAREWCREKVRGVLGAVSVSAAAWLGSLPLAAWYFQLVTPVSLLTNLVMVPLAGLVVLSGLCSWLCGPWWPWATECFNHAGWLVMWTMMRIGGWASALPGAWWPVERPSLLFMFGYAVFLLLPLGVAWSWHRRIAQATVAVLALALGLWLPQAQRVQTVRITVLPVGGGDCLWVDPPGRHHDLLIDTGDVRAVDWVVAPFLKAEGRRRIPALLLTHGDTRHVSGAPALLREFEIGQVLVGPGNPRSVVYRRSLEVLQASGRTAVVLERGQRWGSATVLHPAAQDRFTRADDQVVVLRFDWYGTRVLLCSDLGRFGQDLLIEREPELEVDIVVAGMPNGEEPLREPLLDLLRPKAIVLSTGRYPADQEPSRALRQRLARTGVPVFFTGDQGAVTISADSRGWKVRAMDGAWVQGQ